MTEEALKLANNLLEFINNSPVSFIATKEICTMLDRAGFKRLYEDQKWDLSSNDGYYVVRNSSAVIAFKTGKKKPQDSGFSIVGAHTDSPLLKLKTDSFSKSAGFFTIGVESYGGGINSTWLDRDLSIAGRLTVLDDGVVTEKIVDFKRPIALIPNLAIHLNRDVNKGFEYNKQTHLNAIIQTNGDPVENLTFTELLEQEFSINKDSILEMDLYLYDAQKGSVLGLDNGIISVGRLDNLAMCHSILTAIIDSERSDTTSVGLFLDNEEIGSETLQGANSNFISSVLDRIIHSFNGSIEDRYIARKKSFMISADGAHALHPNFKEKHDSSYAPIINKGPVIKMSSNFRYSTTSNSAAKFMMLCKQSDVPFQKMVNRSDIPSGSTIGPMTSAALGIEAVDVGNPMLAMHSIRESQGVLDHFYMTKILTSFYNS